jgi:hypothetical protein
MWNFVFADKAKIRFIRGNKVPHTKVQHLPIPVCLYGIEKQSRTIRIFNDTVPRYRKGFVCMRVSDSNARGMTVLVKFAWNVHSIHILLNLVLSS